MRRAFVLILNLFIVAAVGVAVGCAEQSNDTQNQPDGQNTNSVIDLSILDIVSTEAEVIRLLKEDHVMYVRIEMFNTDGVVSPACPNGGLGETPFSCTSWPKRIVLESWEDTDATGHVRHFIGRRGTQDGTTIAVGIHGQWTDLNTGESWTSAPHAGWDLVGAVDGMAELIDRVKTDPLPVTEGEYLGRPSIVIPAADIEFQLANPFLFRQTIWGTSADGKPVALSGIEVTDMAMLPPGSFPEFAHVILS